MQEAANGGVSLNLVRLARLGTLGMSAVIHTCDFEGCAFVGAKGQADSSSQCSGAAAGCEVSHCVVCAHQGRGAGRVNAHAGALQGVCVGYASSCNACCPT